MAYPNDDPLKNVRAEYYAGVNRVKNNASFPGGLGNFIAGKKADGLPSAYDLTKQNMKQGYGIVPAVGLGIKNAIVDPAAESLRNAANTGLNAAGKVSDYLFSVPGSPAQTQQTPPAVQESPVINQAQASQPPTQTAQLPKPTQKAVGFPGAETAQQFMERTKGGTADKTGYVQMPGNPGNQRYEMDYDTGLTKDRMMPGVVGQTTRPDLGIKGYDTNGKPIFDRTEPATYAIENGKVTKYGQDGKQLGLSAFGSNPDSGKGMDFGMSKEQRAALPAGNPFASDAMSQMAANGVSASDRLAALNYLSADQSTPLADQYRKAQYMNVTGLGGATQTEEGSFKNPYQGALAAGLSQAMGEQQTKNSQQIIEQAKLNAAQKQQTFENGLAERDTKLKEDAAKNDPRQLQIKEAAQLAQAEQLAAKLLAENPDDEELKKSVENDLQTLRNHFAYKYARPAFPTEY